jgi:putative ABC transport system permease protein
MGVVRHRIRQMDADMRIGTPLLVSERIARSARGPRFVLMLFGLFAGVAVLLSAIGVYGLVSYAFAQRVREIGVRISLGATPRDILRLVMTSGFAAVLTGSVMGLLGTVAAARLLGSALPQLEPLRPWAVVVACALLVSIGWVACYIPARRALRIDPVDALRST